MNNDGLQNISIELLQPHPQNPRLVMREDVVDSIVAQLTDSGEFDVAHALLVRPVNNHFEILSGHHRYQAAKLAGVDILPCWVREMSDEDAYMQLVLGNSQGELSPVEYAIHIYKKVQRSEGGNHERGGLSEYARQIGKTQAYVSQLFATGQVICNILDKDPITRVIGLLDKAKHLLVIHKLPESLWPELVNDLIEKDWSLVETESVVKKILQYLEYIESTRTELPETVTLYRFSDGDYHPYEFQARQHFDSEIEKHERRSLADAKKAYRSIVDSIDNNLKEYREWLEAQASDAEKQAQRAAREAELMAKYINENCLDVLPALPEKSVQLLLTDPPYGMGFQSNRRVASAKAEKIEGDDSIESAITLTGAMLDAIDHAMADVCHVLMFCTWRTERFFMDLLQSKGYDVRASLVWVKENHTSGDLNGFAPQHERILHATRGNAKIEPRVADVLMFARENSTGHPTEKPTALLKELIGCTTQPGQQIVDPFAGTGATVVAALQLDRDVLGIEVNTDYHNEGYKRIYDDILSDQR